VHMSRISSSDLLRRLCQVAFWELIKGYPYCRRKEWFTISVDSFAYSEKFQVATLMQWCLCLYMEICSLLPFSVALTFSCVIFL
jgi:hypothetical protein